MKSILLILLFLLFSLRSFPQTSVTPTSEEQSIYWHVISNDYYGNVVSPAIFIDSAKVFSEPDTSGKILETLRFHTGVILHAKGLHANDRVWWYKIDFGGVSGYVQAENIATHTFASIQKGTGNSLYYFTRLSLLIQ